MSFTAGRPSARNQAKLMESLRDTRTIEELKRVNFEVVESKHTKLKVNAARQGMSVKDFLTAYIDSLPD
jgi:hypothetical protein